MEESRIEQSGLCSTILNPTEAEVRELLGDSVASYIFVERGGNPNDVIFTPFMSEFIFDGPSGRVAFSQWLNGEQVEDWNQNAVPQKGQECEGFTYLVYPSLHDLVGAFPPHVVDKIIRHLDIATGDPARGEVQCTGIQSVISNGSFIGVFYATSRADGSRGTKFMRFYTHTHVVRCLVVAKAKPGEVPDVLRLNEYRRSRGERVQMCLSGGESEPTLLDVLRSELREEMGVELDDGCEVYSLGAHQLDDGVCSDPVHLLVATGVTPAEQHSNQAEGISEVQRVQFFEWQQWALRGACRDFISQYFAARCTWSVKTNELVTQGKISRIL